MKNIYIRYVKGVRLGNLLYMIYSALSKRPNKIFLDSIWFEIQDGIIREFDIVKDGTIEEYNTDDYPEDKIPYVYYFENTDTEIEDVDGDVVFWGLFQNYNIFKNEIDYIRSSIKCPKKYEDDIIDKFGDVSDAIIIQIRRGDFLYHKDEFTVPTAQWYINQYEKYFNGRRCIIISDDINWCKENFDNNVFEFSEGNNMIFDFFLMVKSFGIICSSSTFSLTAGILNPNKNLIVPSPFYQEKFSHFKLYPIPDFAIHADVGNLYEKT